MDCSTGKVRYVLLLRPQFHFPLQADSLFLFNSLCNELRRKAGHKVRDETCQQIADRQRKRIQSAREHAVCNAKPQEQFSRIDVLENAAVGMAVVTCRSKISRFVPLRQISSHGDRHGISQNDCRQEGKDHISQGGIGAALCRQPLYPGPPDHAGHGVHEDQEQKHLRQQLGHPGKQLVCSGADYILNQVGQEHKHPRKCNITLLFYPKGWLIPIVLLGIGIKCNVLTLNIVHDFEPTCDHMTPDTKRPRVNPPRPISCDS